MHYLVGQIQNFSDANQTSNNVNLEIPIGTSHIRYQTSKGGSLESGSLH